ncbi:MAG: hypothetical protein HYV40_01705 [Candidatus Levybacteria bacterium]|nr:hypothetical protein [Candidatus Levybacteria bacterium]
MKYSWGDGHEEHDFLAANGSFFAVAHEANHGKSRRSEWKQMETRIRLLGKPIMDLSDDELIEYIRYVSGEEELAWAGALRDLRRIKEGKGVNLEPEFTARDLLFQMNYCLADYGAREARVLYETRRTAREGSK